MHINPQYLAIEIAVYILAALTLRHAGKIGPRRVGEFMAALLYGILLEKLTMWQAQNYGYGRFAIMVGSVPLAIGVGWGLILYSAMATSDYLQLPSPVRPLLDALLALHIDLNMDPVANRIGMWIYEPGGSWFGVPYGNFFGWLAAVISFSACMRYLRQHTPWRVSRGRWLELIYPMLAFPPALISLGVLNQLLLLYLGRGYPGGILVWTVVGFCALIIARFIPRCKLDNRPDAVIISIPFIFQAYFVSLIFVNGYAWTVQALAPVSITIWAIGLLAYSLPFWHYLTGRLSFATDIRKGSHDDQ